MKKNPNFDTFSGVLLRQAQDTSPKDTGQCRSETQPFRAGKDYAAFSINPEPFDSAQGASKSAERSRSTNLGLKPEVIRRIDLWLISLALLAMLLIFPGYAVYAATFNLSHRLLDGGSNLQLNRTNPYTPPMYKRVEVSITSDLATRYRVIHKIAQPIRNRDNPSILIGKNFVVHSLVDNRYGDLRIKSYDMAVPDSLQGDTIYYSDNTGNQDTFTLAYDVVNSENLVPGVYEGQIAYVLVPIASRQAEDTEYLNVYITVSEEGGVSASIKITPQAGLHTIMLNPAKEGKQTAYVDVKISGQFKGMFEIEQLMPRPITSGEGKQLDYGAIKVETEGVRKTMPIKPPIPLSAGFQTLYASLPNGDADQDFDLIYSVGDLSNEKAGTYKSSLQYFLNEQGKQSTLATLNLELEIEPVFDLAVTPQDQKTTIEFPLKPKEPAKTSEVVIDVKTNTGKQYQVSQNVSSDLYDTASGKIISSKYFTLKTQELEDTEVKGALKFMQKAEVKAGDTVLFVSDKKGSPDKFKVIYELVSPLDIVPGDYTASIVYSLMEI